MFETMADDFFDEYLRDWQKKSGAILSPSAREAFRAGVAAALLIESKIREVLGVIPSK